MPVKILNFPKIIDPRGNLTFIQNPSHIPFEIKRVFWQKGVTGENKKTGYASANQEQVIIAIKGSFDVIVTKADGSTEKITLDKPYYGLYIPILTWVHCENFSTEAIAFHLTNKEYDSSGHLNDFELFKNKAG